ncbi:MAG: helix-turn-helix domain-containing protein [Methylococcales bacterium]|nr:helix-turn-helix domain-containing protein [Methylococcales bacterium]
MKTLNLNQAAAFLNCHPETLRRQAKKGLIPGRKTGKSWLFIEEHLADWVSGRFETKTIEKIQCPSINVAKIKRGGLILPTQTANEYAKVLGLK